MKIEIDNCYELLALHKSLMAVKFDVNSCLREAQGSPYTASLAFKIFDQLVSSSNEQRVTEWLTWQVANEDRAEYQLLLRHIKEAEWWVSAELAAKTKYVQDFMAPLKLESKLLNEITTRC